MAVAMMAQAPTQPLTFRTEAACDSVDSALAALAGIRSSAVVRVRAGFQWQKGIDGTWRPSLWVAAELDPAVSGHEERWESGAEVSLTMSGEDGVSFEGPRRLLTQEARSALLCLEPQDPLPPGGYAIHASAQPVGGLVGTSETVRVVVPPFDEKSPNPGRPLLFRRGPFTGREWQPAGDLRFHRQERVKVEVAVAGAFSGGVVRLLDRVGKPLPLPVVTTLRDEKGSTTIAGELVLAPLGFGDYLLETTVGKGADARRLLVAFRIVP